MKTGKLHTFEVDGNRVLAHFEKQEIMVTILTPELIHVFVPLKRQEQKSQAIEGGEGNSGHIFGEAGSRDGCHLHGSAND